MSFCRNIVDRKQDTQTIDKGVKNKWNWKWMEKTVAGTFLDHCIRKLDFPGKAYCLWCLSEINYASRGWKVLEKHCLSKKHLDSLKVRNTNYTITAAADAPTPRPYSIHPMFGRAAQESMLPVPKPAVSVSDRKANNEAMLLGFIAENSLPFTMAPKLIGLSKALASDRKALDSMSMDRTTASYKMRLGLGKTLEEELVEDLKKNKFSMNIDEATSKTLHKILTILVSYFSEEKKVIVVKHLQSISMIKLNSESIYTAIDSLLDKHNIPWKNVMSVLMDSCNVMRGTKTGVETRIRTGPAPHLLDIDGDTVHHAHNAAKKFSGAFEKYLEMLYTNLYNDFKWSPDLRDSLKEICSLLGIKFAMPQRYVPTRWLSVYDVSLDFMRLMDAYTVFYYAFLPPADRVHFLRHCVEVYHRRQLSEASRIRLREVQSNLQQKKLTDDGKARKERITEKMFEQWKQTRLNMLFYNDVLPLLKKYVLLFQSKEPLIHKLSDKQLQLTKDFLSCFVPSELVNQPSKKIKFLDLTDENNILPQDQIFYGGDKTSKIFKESKKQDIIVTDFKRKAKAAYIACGTHILKKMPFRNKLLRHLSALDPLCKGNKLAMQYMTGLPTMATNVLDDEEVGMYCLEVRRFHVDSKLPPFDWKTQRLDSWWACVFETRQYPILAKMVAALMSCFHGPQVESSFSIMNYILDSHSAKLAIPTFNSLQTVKYALKAAEKSSVECYNRTDFLHAPINTKLLTNIRGAAKLYKDEQITARMALQEKKAKMCVTNEKAATKKQSRVVAEKAAKQARKAHMRNVLQKLVAKKVASKRPGQQIPKCTVERKRARNF